MKTSTALASVLGLAVSVGTGLTIYLPKSPAPENTQEAPNPGYEVDQATINSPFKLSSSPLQLSLSSEQALYGLQLGQYQQLSSAVEAAKRINSKQKLTIVKTQQLELQWYVLLLGPFDNKHSALRHITENFRYEQSYIKLVAWPPKEEEKS